MTQPSSEGQPQRRVSLYQRVTDAISYAQGTPANLTFWLIVIGGWIAFGPELAHATFLPGWMGSPTWNFPVNTGTSILELFIGFLVSASTNRSERNLENTLAAIAQQETQIGQVEDGLRADMQANTDLTRQVHELTEAIHRLLSAPPAPNLAAGTGPASAAADGGTAGEPAPAARRTARTTTAALKDKT